MHDINFGVLEDLQRIGVRTGKPVLKDPKLTPKYTLTGRTRISKICLNSPLSMIK